MARRRRFEGRVAVVTGASRGIGRAVALALAQAGADVVVNYHSDQQGGEAVAEEIRQLGRRSCALGADVGDSAQARRLVHQAVETLGRLDVLVNNAGVTLWSTFLDMPEETWDRTIDTNLKGAFICAQAAAQHMVRQGGGHIVNISSGAGKGAFRGAAAYNASKGGLNLLTMAMATELARYNILVNAVAPGAIQIERTLRDDPQYGQTWGQLIPQGRVGLPEDVARVVVFLCSAEAGYVTGQVLYVDGGLFSAVPWPQPYIDDWRRERPRG
jgi:NAD(P)-dependent dehydrogenase (short-subunit alcohol dehydrogenase family)